MSSLPPSSEKPRAVQRMFDRLAPRYDRMNGILTFRMDGRWRRDLAAELGIGPTDRVLDLACGTGDFASLAAKRGATVTGADFSGVMLRAAAEREPGRAWVRGDALRLPFAPGSFDVVVSGFALRNFAAIPPVIGEAARVLGPGGRLGFLEVDRPANPVLRAGHRLYFDRAVPLLGGLLSGDREAYRYLPQSTAYLPPAAELAAMIRAAGFERVLRRTRAAGAIQQITAVRA